MDFLLLCQPILPNKKGCENVALATPISITRSGKSTTTNYDILNENLQLCADLLELYPDFQTSGLECNIVVILRDTTPCQIKVNTVAINGKWNDFKMDIIYDMKTFALVKNVILSANNCPYDITVTF